MKPIIREGSRVIQTVGAMRVYLSLTNLTAVVYSSTSFLFIVVQINDSLAELLPSSWAERISMVFERSRVKKTLESIKERFSPSMWRLIETGPCFVPVLVHKIDAIMNLLPHTTWIVQQMASAGSQVTRTLYPIIDRAPLAYFVPLAPHSPVTTEQRPFGSPEMTGEALQSDMC